MGGGPGGPSGPISYVVTIADNCPCSFSGSTQTEFGMEPSATVSDLEGKIRVSIGMGQGTLPFRLLSLVTWNGLELHSHNRLVDYLEQVRLRSIVTKHSRLQRAFVQTHASIHTFKRAHKKQQERDELHRLRRRPRRHRVMVLLNVLRDVYLEKVAIWGTS